MDVSEGTESAAHTGTQRDVGICSSIQQLFHSLDMKRFGISYRILCVCAGGWGYQHIPSCDSQGKWGVAAPEEVCAGSMGKQEGHNLSSILQKIKCILFMSLLSFLAQLPPFSLFQFWNPSSLLLTFGCNNNEVKAHVGGADLVVALSLTGHVQSCTATFLEMCILVCALWSFNENLQTFSPILTLTVHILSSHFSNFRLRSNLISFKDLIVVTCPCIWILERVEQHLCNFRTCRTRQRCSHMQWIKAASLKKKKKRCVTLAAKTNIYYFK